MVLLFRVFTFFENYLVQILCNMPKVVGKNIIRCDFKLFLM